MRQNRKDWKKDYVRQTRIRCNSTGRTRWDSTARTEKGLGGTDKDKASEQLPLKPTLLEPQRWQAINGGVASGHELVEVLQEHPLLIAHVALRCWIDPIPVLDPLRLQQRCCSACSKPKPPSDSICWSHGPNNTGQTKQWVCFTSRWCRWHWQISGKPTQVLHSGAHKFPFCCLEHVALAVFKPPIRTKSRTIYKYWQCLNCHYAQNPIQCTNTGSV